MRRGYTAESYLAQIARLRALVPHVALSTDIIVGFPGETEADFEATCALMERVRYDSAFVFKYSPRPGTEAAGWPDDVPQPVKERRNQAILELQARISREKLETWVGARGGGARRGAEPPRPARRARAAATRRSSSRAPTR